MDHTGEDRRCRPKSDGINGNSAGARGTQLNVRSEVGLKTSKSIDMERPGCLTRHEHGRQLALDRRRAVWRNLTKPLQCWNEPVRANTYSCGEPNRWHFRARRKGHDGKTNRTHRRPGSDDAGVRLYD